MVRFVLQVKLLRVKLDLEAGQVWPSLRKGSRRALAGLSHDPDVRPMNSPVRQSRRGPKLGSHGGSLEPFAPWGR